MKNLHATTPVLGVQRLQAWYGESHILHGVDLEVGDGQVLAVLGRNGAGKTTTLRAIMGLVPKRRGAILHRGTDVSEASPRRVARSGIGFVPEDRGIYASLTVEENMLLPRRLGDASIPLEELFDWFPNLKNRWDSAGTSLSGGEQQMLALARILHSGARTLLLDEPTEGLAPVIVQKILEVLQTLKARGYTILLVEQNLRFVQEIADELCVLELGRVVDRLPGAEFKAQSARINSYLKV